MPERIDATHVHKAQNDKILFGIHFLAFDHSDLHLQYDFKVRPHLLLCYQCVSKSLYISLLSNLWTERKETQSQTRNDVFTVKRH